jgi:hypothetical protein
MGWVGIKVRAVDSGLETLLLQRKDGDGAGFRAGIKADTAASAPVAFVFAEVVPAPVQTITEFHATNRTRLDTKPASFAFFLVDLNPTSVYFFFALIWHLV